MIVVCAGVVADRQSDELGRRCIASLTTGSNHVGESQDGKYEKRDDDRRADAVYGAGARGETPGAAAPDEGGLGRRDANG